MLEMKHSLQLSLLSADNKGSLNEYIKRQTFKYPKFEEMKPPLKKNKKEMMKGGDSSQLR